MIMLWTMGNGWNGVIQVLLKGRLLFVCSHFGLRATFFSLGPLRSFVFNSGRLWDSNEIYGMLCNKLEYVIIPCAIIER